MNKQTFYSILPYAIILVVCTVLIVNFIHGCNKPVTEPAVRDSTEQRIIDSINTLRKDLNRQQEVIDSALKNNDIGLKANEIIFRKLMNDFMNRQNANRKLPLNEQWNNYLKELESE